MLVTEMAKLQARTVGGTEDYVVTREFKALVDDREQRLDVLRACFAVGGRERHDLGRGDRGHQPDRRASSTSTRRRSTRSGPTTTSSCRPSSSVRRIAGNA